MGDFPSGHTKPQKEMVRKRTESGMSKAVETGALCNTFIAYVFWNPTYKELQGVGHLPDGMDIPDVNEFLREFFLSGGTRAQRSRRRNLRRQGLREANKVLEEIVVDPSNSDASNSEGANTDRERSKRTKRKVDSVSTYEQSGIPDVPTNNPVQIVTEEESVVDTLSTALQSPSVPESHGQLGFETSAPAHFPVPHLEEDGTFDWDMMDAPSDLTQSGEFTALLNEEIVQTPSDILNTSSNGTDALSARKIHREQIMSKAWELMEEFKKILRA